MFRPNTNNLNVGDRVVLTRDMRVLSGVFESGTEMTVTGYGDRGYDFVDCQGNQLLETGLVSNFYRKA
jgi:uncharacterized Zn ribbon protein